MRWRGPPQGCLKVTPLNEAENVDLPSLLQKAAAIELCEIQPGGASGVLVATGCQLVFDAFIAVASYEGLCRPQRSRVPVALVGLGQLVSVLFSGKNREHREHGQAINDCD